MKDHEGSSPSLGTRTQGSMKNVMILGANPNKHMLGTSIIDVFLNGGYQVSSVCRSDVDLNKPDWFDIAIGDKDYDIIILNAYDRNNHGMQLEVFKTLLEKYKDDETKQLAVIGSTTHYFGNTSQKYDNAKRDLHEYFMKFGIHDSRYKCKLMLFEPGVLENFLQNKDKYPVSYSSFSTISKILFNLVQLNLKFIQISLREGIKSP